MKKIIAGLSLAMFAGAASAVEVGTGIWQQTTSGNLADNQLNLGDLGLESSNDMYLYVDVNLPLFLPDLKFRNQSLVSSGSGTVTFSQTFAGETFSIPGVAADSTLDLTYTDVVTHFGLPLPLVDLDFGLNFRLANGSLEIDPDAGPAQSGDISLILPMGHVAAGAKLPLTGLSVYGELNTLPLGGASVSDIMVKGRYKLPLPTLVLDLGVEAGYHQFEMEVGDKVLGMDTSDLQSNVSSKGLFVGVSAKF